MVGAAQVWGHGLWKRRGMSPGLGTHGYAGCSASQQQIKGKRQQRKKKREWPNTDIFKKKKKKGQGDRKSRNQLAVFCQVDGLDRLKN